MLQERPDLCSSQNDVIDDEARLELELCVAQGPKDNHAAPCRCDLFRWEGLHRRCLTGTSSGS